MKPGMGRFDRSGSFGVNPFAQNNVSDAWYIFVDKIRSNVSDAFRTTACSPFAVECRRNGDFEVPYLES